MRNSLLVSLSLSKNDAESARVLSISYLIHLFAMLMLFVGPLETSLNHFRLSDANKFEKFAYISCNLLSFFLL